MSRSDNGVEDVDDEFTKQAKDAANAVDETEDAAPAAKKTAEAVDSKGTAKDTTKGTGKPTDKAAGKPTDESADKPKKRSRREPKPQKIASGLNPTWWVPTMLGLMVLGLIWLVVFYLSGSKYPIPNIGNYNLAIGFVLLMAGFAMTTRWK